MRKKQTAPNPPLRLAALLTGQKVTAADLKSRFALSSNDTQKLGVYLANPLVFEGQFNASNLSFCLYRYGFDLTEDFLVLAQAQAAQFHWESAAPVLEKWVPKAFPLRGEDILALGVPSGFRVGQILSAVESWWMDKNFLPDRKACLDEAQRIKESNE
jgi:poly(A) polymerase